MRDHGTKTAALVIAWSITTIACGNGCGAPETGRASGDVAREPAERSLEAAPPIGEPAPTPAEPVPGPGLFSLFDFAANLEHAHVRSRGLLVDFGTASRHKHTLGDWRTGWRGDYLQGDTAFSYTSGAAARVFFDALPEEEGGGRIELRARAVGSRRGRVYLNGGLLGSVELADDGFGHAQVAFDDGIRPGRNEILLRFETRRPAHDGRIAGAAVDYLRVVPAGTPSGPAAAAVDGLLTAAAGGVDGEALALAEGESLTFNLPIPKGAVLGGRVRAKEGSPRAGLVVTARRDDGRTLELARLEAGIQQIPLSLPLEEMAGDTAAITVAVTAGEAVLTGVGLFAPPVKAVEAPGRPAAKNVVLVLIDTLRADKLTIYNPRTRVKTPHMDFLAREAMVFNRPLAQENWTKPSVATLLTGLHPETHGTKNEKHVLPASATMISEHLRSVGFATAGFVANGYISNKFGFQRGWDTWTNYVREGKRNRAQFVMDDAVAWLGRRPQDKPFFLYVHTIDPHVPYVPPVRYRALYDNEPYDGPVRAAETAKLLERIKTGAIRLTARDRFRLEALYDGEVTYHDDHLARLYEALARQGLLDDTLLIVTSDHGEEFFEHGSVGHGHSIYEEMLHVPLVVRLPGAGPLAERATSEAEVGLVDVVPTVCEILGVDCLEGIEGRSLVPLMTGAGIDGWPQASFSDFLDGQRVVRSGRYKLVYRGLATTLFDLETDPGETADLSGERPVSLAAMRDLLGLHQGRFVPAGEVDGAAPVRPRRAASKAPARKTHKAEETEIDPETRKQLEALGYMGD